MRSGLVYYTIPMKKQIITIAGKPGSGKSSTAKGVASALKFGHFSSGDLFRSIGQEKGLDILNANLSAEQNADIDHAVDARLREIGAHESQLVIDSRTAWHWMPESFKVFLDLDIAIAAKRIIANMDPERLKHENISSDPYAYAAELQKRLDSESRRYTKLYAIDPYVTNNYDLVIDTSAHTLEEVIEHVTNAYQAWIKD